MQVCNTQYNLFTRLLLFMVHSRTLSVPLIMHVCTLHSSLTHKFSLISFSILVSYLSQNEVVRSPLTSHLLIPSRLGLGSHVDTRFDLNQLRILPSKNRMVALNATRCMKAGLWNLCACVLVHRYEHCDGLISPLTSPVKFIHTSLWNTKTGVSRQLCSITSSCYSTNQHENSWCICTGVNLSLLLTGLFDLYFNFNPLCFEKSLCIF
jgi:hypothetical protein